LVTEPGGSHRNPSGTAGVTTAFVAADLSIASMTARFR